MHNHSVKSDDARAKVENYCQWIRSRELPLDGIVLTEHRQFEPTDYSPLEKKYGLVILEGSEVETEYGHVLVYGVTEGLKREFDFERVDNPLAEVLAAVENTAQWRRPRILDDRELACLPTLRSTAFPRASISSRFTTVGAVPTKTKSLSITLKNLVIAELVVATHTS